MYIRQKQLIVVIYVLVAVLATSPIAAGDKDVNVINEPTVHSEQSGFWGVDIVNSDPIPVEVTNQEDVSKVEVTNTPLPVEAQSYPREPFARYLTGYHNPDGCVRLEIETPTDKRFVIEHVSYRTVITDITTLTFAAVEQASYRHYLNIGRQLDASVGFVQYQGGQAIRIYAQPGETIGVRFCRDPWNGVFQVYEATVTGYLLPLNSPTLGP